MVEIVRDKDGSMSPEVNEIFDQIVGQPCTRKEVGSMRSISLGFGEESLEPRRRKRQYRRWELGTYSGDWKVANDAGVLLEKSSSRDVGELDAKLGALHFGRLTSIQQISKSGVRMNLDNRLLWTSSAIRRMTTSTSMSSVQSAYVEFSERGWQVGRSDTPWTAEAGGPGLDFET
jgi:hypothetical protein